MKRKDLVKKTGISKQRLSEYSTKKTVMTVETMYTIALAIGCEEKDLYERNVVKKLWQEGN
nr:helix-turn-helix transcriptional regulator [Paenibacillus psychroresistens]